MSHSAKNFIGWILVTVLFLGIMPLAASAEAAAPEPVYFDLPVTVDTVKVGLCFESNAVDIADVASLDNKGFLFGYYDVSRVFHELGRTSASYVSVRRDTGFALEGGTYVGPWHIILDKSFSDFDSAQECSIGYWGGFVGYVDGEYRVLTGAYKSEDKADAAISDRGLRGKTFKGSEYSLLAARKDTSELIFLYDAGEKTELAVKPGNDGRKLCFNYDHYLGGLGLRSREGKITVVNYVALESYVKCVLPYEMYAAWPKEALAAQGLCARNYAINNIDTYYELGFDVRNDTYSQVYRGTTGTTKITDTAVDETKGEYIRYKGAVCKVYYMSSDGGATDSGANVFSRRRAYLTGTVDDTESRMDFYNKSWKAELLESTVLRRLNNNGVGLSDIKSIKPYRENGKIISSLEIKDSKGKTAVICGEDCFRFLGLNSLNFTVDRKTASNGETVWVFNGKGWGHNCGMSQWGAYSLAENKNYRCGDIIAFYFSGAYVA